MSYPTGFFDDEMKAALEEAISDASSNRQAEVELDDFIAMISRRQALETALNRDHTFEFEADRPPVGLLGKLRRPTQPVLSKSLRSKLDDARFHARQSDSSKTSVVHFFLALSSRPDPRLADALAAANLTSKSLDLLVYGPPKEPEPVVVEEPDTSLDGLDVRELWAEAERLLSARGIDPTDYFLPPAGEESIASAEQQLGVHFPPDYRASLECHEGGVGTMRMHGVAEFLRLSRVRSEWALVESDRQRGFHNDSIVTAAAEVQPVFWHSGWIPVVQMAGNTEYFCLDCAPTEVGRVGQVIEYAMDEINRNIVFESWTDYLRWWVLELKHADDRLVSEHGLLAKFDI
jgi:cell wall assembly regulator SMI1